LKEDLEFFEEFGRWKPPQRQKREERRERRTGFRRRSRSRSRSKDKKNKDAKKSKPTEDRPTVKEMDSKFYHFLIFYVQYIKIR